MPTTESLNKVQNLYIAYYGRPADPEGLNAWAEQLDNAGGDASAIIDLFGDSPEYTNRFGDLSNEELVNNLYQQLFGRDAETEGLELYTGLLDSGEQTLGSIALTILENASGDDVAVVANRKAVADAFVAALDTPEEVAAYRGDDAAEAAKAMLASVDADTDVEAFDVDSVVAQLVADAPEEPTEPTEPSVPGETFQLTDGREGSGRDVVTGTDGDDTFMGLVGQNQDGAIANAFSTGDYINGGAGRDKVEATVMEDQEVESGADAMINPRTENVEEIYFEALALANDDVVSVDAGRLDSVEQFWSDNSSASLFIDDVRLGSKLNVTKDITFGMRDVDTESSLFAAFETQSLTNEGDTRFNSQIVVEVGDSNKPADSEDPLELVELTLNFTYQGTPYSLEDIRSTDGTYDGLAAALRAALDAEGLTNLVITDGNPLTSIQAENTVVPLVYNSGKQIIITDPAGNEFSDFTTGVGAAPSAQSSNPISNTSVREADTASTMIETNVILDNAGRGSTAGDVVIGGMSNSEQAIEKLNLIVDRTSRIDDLTSAVDMSDGNPNDDYVGFEVIELTSMGANGSLSVNDIQNTATFDASAFQGETLTIGNADALQTLSANITADVNVTADTAAAANSYTTGAGDDVLSVTIQGDDVDTAGESFTANTNGGDDTVNIIMNEEVQGVSFNTMATLENLTINTGAGEDMVNLDGYGTFDINTGSSSDFVRINSVNNNGNATTGTWTVGDTSDAVNNYFDERVLYQSKLTVTFAGFEQTVDVQTDRQGNFVATQETINNAIKAAIDANHELSDLLNYSDSTGNQALTITSTVGGLNNLGIAIYQPQLVAASGDVTTGEDAGENVLLATGDVDAIRKGLIQTGVETDSSDLENVAEIVTATNAFAPGWYGSVAADGTADEILSSNAEIMGDVTTGANVADTDGGIFQDSAGSLYFAPGTATSGTNSTTGLNLSSINVGNGSNDIVVMHSADLSSNTLVIDQTFGKVSVVNWHTAASEDVETVGAMGEHALDFSAYLNNQEDESDGDAAADNGDSATAIATTVNLAAGASSFAAAVSPGVNNNNTAVANSVNVIRFAQDFANDETFAELDAATLVAALNDANNDGSTDFGNINQGLLTPNAEADLVGSTQKHIIMVENDLNEGEYKVFYVTSTLNEAKDATAQTGSGGNNLFDTNAVELGTLDFGASINFNVAGSVGYTSYVNALMDAVDNDQVFFTFDEDGNGTVANGEGLTATEGSVVVLADEQSYTATEGTDVYDASALVNTDVATINSLEVGDVIWTDLTFATGTGSVDNTVLDWGFADKELTIEVADGADGADVETVVLTLTGVASVTEANGVFTVASLDV